MRRRIARLWCSFAQYNCRVSPLYSKVSPRRMTTAPAGLEEVLQLKPESSTQATLGLLSTSKIYTLSRDPCNRNLVFNQAALYADTKTPPDAQLYIAIFRAMTFSTNTLYEEAMALFHEMMELQIQPNLETCELIVKLLIKSPTVMEIEQVLDYMRQNNIELSEDIWESRILHAFESHQLEVALSLLEERDAHLSAKTYSLAISELCRVNEAATALGLIKKMMSKSMVVSTENWLDLLKASALSYFSEGVNLAWSKGVEAENLLPSEGLLMLVLNVAARHGNSSLATSAMTLISMREIDFQEHHYAPLVEAYAREGELKNAFIVLHVVRQGNGLVSPSEATAYPLFKALTGNPTKVDEAFSLLKDIHEESKQVDIVALNTVINAAIFHQDLEKAVKIFREAGSFGLQPDVGTFIALLDGAAHLRHGEFAKMVWKEMIDANVTPNQQCFERMIYTICRLDDYEDAFQYLELEKAAGFKPSRSVYSTIIKICVANRDARANIALEEMVSLGYEKGLLETWIRVGGRPLEVRSYDNIYEQLDYSGYVENSRFYGGAGERALKDTELPTLSRTRPLSSSRNEERVFDDS